MGIPQDWAARAGELAQWAWERLVNRTDVWGGYNAVEDRNKIIMSADGTEGILGTTTTRPAKSRRGRDRLTLAILERHFRTGRPRDVVGLHTTSAANLSRWGAVEVDHHGETSTPGELNLLAALAWYERLQALGLVPLLTDSNGNGGYHLLVPFAKPVCTASVFRFLHWLTADYAAHRLPTKPETFPKQSRVEPGHYGNWLRIPGRHHTRPHWSRVWREGEWLEGAEAVMAILAIAGSDPLLIPAEALTHSARQQKAAPRRSNVNTQGRLAHRARAYMARLPTNLGEGQQRDDHAFRFASFLVHDLQLSDSEILNWLSEWNGKQREPKPMNRLEAILKNAHLYGGRRKSG